jgi:tellurite resistance protein TerC
VLTAPSARVKPPEESRVLIFMTGRPPKVRMDARRRQSRGQNRRALRYARLIGTAVPVWAWVVSVGAILILLVVDLGVNGRRRPTMGRAIAASAAWILVSCLFGAVLGLLHGGGVSEQYFTAYFLEKSLSVDNVFVFVALFAVFAVPGEYQHRVLYFGVLGALILRAAFITAGGALLDDVNWMLYVFGVIVVVGGLRMLKGIDVARPEDNRVIRTARRFLPMTEGYVEDRFVVRRNGKWVATPLLLALVGVESTDVVFATDSIPAVFGVTRDIFIVFTSNAFAVLGLRALYFVVAGLVDRLRFLKYGLAVLMVFIGTKLLLSDVVHLSVSVSLGIMAVTLGLATALSLLVRPKADRVGTAEPPGGTRR